MSVSKILDLEDINNLLYLLAMGDISRVGKRPGGTGRKKIDIKKIENEDNLMVTFSKRRNGLFKKASELCLLSGSQIAIIVFSPRGRTYLYGHPSAVSVLNLFLGTRSNPAHHSQNVHNAGSLFHKQTNNNLCPVVKGQNKPPREEEEVATTNGDCVFWWDALDIGRMDLHQLQRFKHALQELRTKVAEKMKNKVVGVRSYLVFNPVMVFEPVLQNC